MELIHTLNRGVDKREIFLDDQDRFRFIHDLFEFNNTEAATNVNYFFRQSMDIASRYIKKRNLLVNTHAFCLMLNHYHLLLSEKVQGGIPRFMKKLNIGYAKYFNEKYQRSGALFEGRYKKVVVKKEAHFIHLPYYIHLNPLDLVHPEWRNRELKNYKEAIEFLENYRWSSHLDYLGKNNFPSLTQREFLMEFFGGPSGYQKNVYDWLKDLNTQDFQGLLLD